jgi:hypothetical protein
LEYLISSELTDLCRNTIKKIEFLHDGRIVFLTKQDGIGIFEMRARYVHRIDDREEKKAFLKRNPRMVCGGSFKAGEDPL